MKAKLQAQLTARRELSPVTAAVRKALQFGMPAFALVGAGLINVSPAVAGPEQGTVVRGVAGIESSAGITNINQATDRAVINWRSFSVGEQEQVNFNQPSSSSATLNRVLGGQRSVIEGALNANGNVFLLNSSGVLLTPSAKVDVGGLVATTSDIRDDDFMQGKLQFTATGSAEGTIENSGTISIRDGGIAAFVSPAVRNNGVIAARAGRVALGAGDVFTLDLYGDQMINFAVPSAANGALQSREITQSGSIVADAGRVLLTTDAAAGVVGGVVNMSGVIQARTVEQSETGEIVLAGNSADVRVAGTLDASGIATGVHGGSVEVTGNSVTLTSTARVDARGDSGGGLAHIGGGFSGEAGPRTSNTIVESGALVDVSAVNSGDAGKVSVWGTDAVDFSGTVAARGGTTGGDGGFIEVSGKGAVKFSGDVEAAASDGRGGTFLLDPADITIQTVGSNNLEDPTVSGTFIRNLLRQGVSVQLLADNSITVNDVIDGRPLLGQNQSTVSGSVSLTAGSILLLQPVITNNAAITLTATSGDISFQGNAYLAVANTAAISGVGNAAVTLTAARNVIANQIISLGRVNVTSSGGNVQLLQALNGLQTSATTVSGIGALTLTANNGSVSTAGAYSHGDVALTGNNVSIAGSVFADDSINILTPGALTLSTNLLSRNGNINIGSATQSVGAFTMGSGTVLQSVDSATAVGQSGGISIYSAGAVSAQDLIAGSAGAVLISSQDAVTLNSGLFGLGNNGTANGIGSLSITTTGAASNIATKGAKTANVINLAAGGSLQNSAASLISTNGPISLAANGIALDTIGSSATLDSGGNVTLTSSGAVNVGGSILSRGALNITTTGAASNLVTNGALVTGAITLDSAGTLTNSSATLKSSASTIGLTGNGITLDIIGAVANPLAALDAAGNVTLTSTGAATLNSSVLSGGALAVTAAGNITTSGARTTSGITLTSTGGGALTNSTTALDADGNITLASTGAVTLSTSLLSRDGSITIGTSTTQRVGALTMASGTALQAVAAATATGQSGGISIYSTGTVEAQDLIAGTSGTVLVDGQGAVTLNKGIFGLCSNSTSPCTGTASGVGALTVNAAGNVVMNGATAKNNISLTSGGALTNSTAELNADGDVTLATPGVVTLSKDVRSGGSIQIGIGTGVQRIASLTTPDEVTLRSDANAGRIDVRSAGAVTAGNLVAGTSGVIDLRGTDVTIAGRINDNLTGAQAGTQGVGEVSIIGTNSIAVHDIRVSGLVHDIQVPGLTADPYGYSLALMTRSRVAGSAGGSVAILRPVVSGGPVFIGQAGTYVADAPYDPNNPATEIATNSQINLSHNITTMGQSVTFNGDITLFAGITRWDIECTVTGVCANPNDPPDLDAALFSPYSGSSTVGLIGFGNAGFADACTLTGSPNGCYATGTLISGPGSQYPAFAQATLTGVGDGTLYNTLSNSSGCSDKYVCGFIGSALNIDSQGNAIDSVAQAAEVALSLERLIRMNRLMGGLTTVVDTTGSGSEPTGAAVTMSGNVGRYRGNAPVSPVANYIYPSFVSHALTVNSGTAGALTIGGKLGDDLSHKDLAAIPALDFNYGAISIGQSLPLVLGTFSVSLSAASINLANLPLQYRRDDSNTASNEGYDFATATGHYLTSLSLNSNSIVCGTTPCGGYGAGNSAFTYSWQFSTTSAGLFQSPANTATPGSSPIFQATPGAGSSGVGSTLPNGSSGFGGSTSLAGSGGAISSSGSATSSVGATTGQIGLVGLKQNTETGRPSTSEDSERRSDEATSSSDADQSSLTQEDTCPRGPAPIADLGQQPAVDGTAPDVFARCHE